MIKKLLRWFGSSLHASEKQLTQSTPLVSEYSTAVDEGVKLEDRLEHVITAWEKRTHNSFKDVILDGHKGYDGWVEKLQRNAALFFGSREYQAYRLDWWAKTNEVKKEVMCTDLKIWEKIVGYSINGKHYEKEFESVLEANHFAIKVLAARKSIYSSTSTHENSTTEDTIAPYLNQHPTEQQL